MAKRKLREFEVEVERKTAAGNTKLTFDELQQRWLEQMKGVLKPSSYARRLSALRQIAPYFREKRLSQITQQEMDCWSARRRSQVKAQTFNIELETIRLIFKYAIKNGWMFGQNAAHEVAKAKRPKVIVVPPTKEEFTRLLAILREEPKATNAVLLVQFLAYTGMRIDEARQVRWSDVDFERETILVTGGEGGTKNHQQRVIPLFQPAKDLLELLKSANNVRPTGPIVSTHTAIRALITASEKLGRSKGKHITHHDLRHFFCSNAVELNIPDHVIAAWLGHKDGGILVKTTYGHLRQTFSDEMAKLMTFTA